MGTFKAPGILILLSSIRVFLCSSLIFSSAQGIPNAFAPTDYGYSFDADSVAAVDAGLASTYRDLRLSGYSKTTAETEMKKVTAKAGCNPDIVELAKLEEEMFDFTRAANQRARDLYVEHKGPPSDATYSSGNPADSRLASGLHKRFRFVEFDPKCATLVKLAEDIERGEIHRGNFLPSEQYEKIFGNDADDAFEPLTIALTAAVVGAVVGGAITYYATKENLEFEKATTIKATKIEKIEVATKIETKTIESVDMVKDYVGADLAGETEKAEDLNTQITKADVEIKGLGEKYKVLDAFIKKHDDEDDSPDNYERCEALVDCNLVQVNKLWEEYVREINKQILRCKGYTAREIEEYPITVGLNSAGRPNMVALNAPPKPPENTEIDAPVCTPSGIKVALAGIPLGPCDSACEERRLTQLYIEKTEVKNAMAAFASTTECGSFTLSGPVTINVPSGDDIIVSTVEECIDIKMQVGGYGLVAKDPAGFRTISECIETETLKKVGNRFISDQQNRNPPSAAEIKIKEKIKERTVLRVREVLALFDQPAPSLISGLISPRQQIEVKRKCFGLEFTPPAISDE